MNTLVWIRAGALALVLTAIACAAITPIVSQDAYDPANPEAPIGPSRDATQNDGGAADAGGAP